MEERGHPELDVDDGLISDVATLSDVELAERIWIAAAMIAARSAVLHPRVVLQLELRREGVPADWHALREKLRQASAPQFLEPQP